MSSGKILYRDPLIKKMGIIILSKNTNYATGIPSNISG